LNDAVANSEPGAAVDSSPTMAWLVAAIAGYVAISGAGGDGAGTSVDHGRMLVAVRRAVVVDPSPRRHRRHNGPGSGG
jgi:hypothetical protein